MIEPVLVLGLRREARQRAGALPRACAMLAALPLSLALLAAASPLGAQQPPAQQKKQAPPAARQPPAPVRPVLTPEALQAAVNVCFAGLAAAEPRTVDETCSSILDNAQNRTKLGYQPDQVGHLYSQRALARVRLANFAGAIADHGEAIRLGHSPHVNFNNLGLIYTNHLLNPALAEKAFRDALAQKPDFVLARLNLARVLIGQNRLRDAIQELQQALQIANRDRELNARVIPQIHGVLGEALYQDRRLEEALRELQEQLRLEPENPSAHLVVAQILSELGRQAEAERLLRSLADRHPNDVDVLAQVGNGFNVIRLWREASEVCSMARRRDETHVEAAICFSVALSALGQFGRAEGELKAAIDRAPQNARVLSALGLLQKRRGRLDEAIATFRRALSIDANAVDARQLLIATLTDRGDLGDALAEVGTALQRNERDAGGLSVRAIIFALNGDQARALGDLEQVRAIIGESSDYWLLRGTVHYYLDVTAEAVRSLREAVRLNAQNGEALRFLGRALVKQTAYAEAEQVLARATTILPFDWQLTRTRGILDLERGRFETARDFLADSLQLNGAFVEGYVALARAYEGLGGPGNANLAEANYRQAVAAQPRRYTYDIDGRLARDYAQRRLDELKRALEKPQAPAQPERIPPVASLPEKQPPARLPPPEQAPPQPGPPQQAPPAQQQPAQPKGGAPPGQAAPGSEIGGSIGRLPPPPVNSLPPPRASLAQAWCGMIRSWSSNSRHYTGIRLGLGCGYEN